MPGLIETSTDSNTTPTENIDPALAAAAPADAEAPLVAEPAQSEEDKRFAAKFAALSRRDKMIAQKEKQLNQKIKEMEDRQKAMEAAAAPQKAPEAPQKSLERRLRENPFDTLKELGIDYATLTNMALNDGKATPEIQQQLLKEDIHTEFMTKIEALEKRLADKEASEKAEREAAAQKSKDEQDNAAISSFKNGIQGYIEQNKETLELVAVEGEFGVDKIYDTIVQDYYSRKAELEEAGEDLEGLAAMTVEEAANKLEEQLLEEAKKRIGLSKIKKLTAPAEPAPPSNTQTPAPKTASPTLSNTKTQVQGGKRALLSNDESKKEAAKLLRWTE